MRLNEAALIFVVLLCFERSYGSRNCSEIVKRESAGLLHYLASVRFPSPRDHNGTWTLELFTDVPYTFIGGWGVVIEPDGDNRRASITSVDTTKRIVKDENISFRLRIAWFTGEPVPEIIGINWEGIDICSPLGTTVSAVQASKRTEYDRLRGNRFPVNG